MRRLLIIAAIAAGTAAVAGIVVYGQMNASLLSDRKATPIKASDRKPAPAISRNTLSGRPIDLRRFAGKPVVINFFASWCVPCRQEARGLAQLGRDFGRHRDRRQAPRRDALRAPVPLDVADRLRPE